LVGGGANKAKKTQGRKGGEKKQQNDWTSGGCDLTNKERSTPGTISKKSIAKRQGLKRVTRKKGSLRPGGRTKSPGNTTRGGVEGRLKIK